LIQSLIKEPQPSGWGFFFIAIILIIQYIPPYICWVFGLLTSSDED